MLYITFKESESVITNVDMFFDNNYEPEWLLDPFVKKIIRDIDKSDVLSENVISSLFWKYSASYAVRWY